MPESIDWPRTQSPHGRRGRRFILILAVLVGILFVGRAALSYYVDVLWFGSLSYADVFWKTLSLQWGVFAAFAAATFLIVYGSFLALKRVHLPDLPSGHTILIGGQPLKLPVEPVLRLIALGVSLAIAVATGGAMAGDWPTLALFWYAPRATVARVLYYICIPPVDPGDACLSWAVRAVARRSYDLRGGDLHGRARHTHRDARRLRGTRSGRGSRSRQCRAGATRALAVGSDPSSCGLLCRGSRDRMVCEQLHRQAERIGAGEALHCLQHRPNAAGLRIESSLTTRVSA